MKGKCRLKVLGVETRIILKWAINNKFWEELITYFPFLRHGAHRRQKNYGEARQCKLWDGLRCHDIYIYIYTNLH
jgi:hypothetical protein